VVQKTDTQFYFCDNFGNTAPILTILLPYKQKFISHKSEVLPFTTPLLCRILQTLPSKTITTAYIGVKCCVLLTKLISR